MRLPRPFSILWEQCFRCVYNTRSLLFSAGTHFRPGNKLGVKHAFAAVLMLAFIGVACAVALPVGLVLALCDVWYLRNAHARGARDRRAVLGVPASALAGVVAGPFRPPWQHGPSAPQKSASRNKPSLTCRT